MQILGAGGDDDTLAGANDRQQVGQRLAGSSTGFDDQMAFFRQRLFYGLRHLQLSAAEFVGRVGLREQAAGREEVVERCALLLRAEQRAGRSEATETSIILSVPPLHTNH